MSGAFLAHGYQANRIVALDAPGTMRPRDGQGSRRARHAPQRRRTRRARRNHRADVVHDERRSRSSGCCTKLIEGVDADAPAAADIERVKASLAAAVEDARNGPRDLSIRLASADAKRTRAASIEVRRRMREQWRRVRDRTPRPHDLLRLAPGRAAFRRRARLGRGITRARAVRRRAARAAQRRRDRGRRARRDAQRALRRVARSAPGSKRCSRRKICARARNADRARAALPAFALLRAVAPLIDAGGLAWGPTGSAGFELASACRPSRRRATSIIVMRAPAPLSRAEATSLFDALSQAARVAGTRIDVQIETRDARVLARRIRARDHEACA